MKLKVLESGSKGNCYILQSNTETLILECGISYKRILKGLNFNLSNVVGCLISHEHKDHSKAMRELLNNGINVWLSEGTLKALQDEKTNPYRLPYLCQSECQFTIGGFTILPFSTEHDAKEPLGFLIQHAEIGKLLFITDSYYCKYKFKNINHILIECNYSKEILNENLENEIIHPALRDRLIKSHFSLENVKEFFKANDLSCLRNIMLIHLSDSNSNPSMFKEEIQKVTAKVVYVASNGLEIEFF